MDPRLTNPASMFYKLEPLRGENLVRVLVAYASGSFDPMLRSRLGERWAVYTNAYAMDGPFGVRPNFLRKAAGRAANKALQDGVGDPVNEHTVAAVQAFIDMGALPPGSSVED